MIKGYIIGWKSTNYYSYSYTRHSISAVKLDGSIIELHSFITIPKILPEALAKSIENDFIAQGYEYCKPSLKNLL